MPRLDGSCSPAHQHKGSTYIVTVVVTFDAFPGKVYSDDGSDLWKHDNLQCDPNDHLCHNVSQQYAMLPYRCLVIDWVKGSVHFFV